MSRAGLPIVRLLNSGASLSILGKTIVPMLFERSDHEPFFKRRYRRYTCASVVIIFGAGVPLMFLGVPGAVVGFFLALSFIPGLFGGGHYVLWILSRWVPQAGQYAVRWENFMEVKKARI